MITSIIFLLKSVLFISIHVLCIISNSNKQPNTNGFSLDLFHIDSLHSPYYNESLPHTQTVLNAIRRSLHRSAGSTETEVFRSTHSGDYLMSYAIGQQKVPSLGIMDTGSDLIWTQCHPCWHCLKQSPPLYRPSNSSSYRKFSCKDFECNRSTHTHCSPRLKRCIYSVTYGDLTSSWGRLSADTFVLASEGGSSTGAPNIVFGCGYRNNGTFYGRESGVVGLGHGNHSLVAQLGNSANGKFSYCLVSRTDKWKTRSKLKFGDSVDVSSGEGVVSTPLVRKDPDTYYYVTLLGFSVGNQSSLFFNDSLLGSIGEGNMFVDSGTTVTTLPDDLYDLLKDSVQRELVNLKPIKDPLGLLDLCFDIRGVNYAVPPTVTFHFRDGADVNFEKENVFFETSRGKSLCLTVLPEGGGGRRPGLLGYFAQANFMVAYDLDQGRVYIKPADCTNF